MSRLFAFLFVISCMAAAMRPARAIDNSSSLAEKARYFQRDLLDKHWLDGLYISIVPSAPPGTTPTHTVDDPGNVIHAGVWTGRYLAGVGYQYAVTREPRVRAHAWEILQGLRVLQEVTGEPGLLARGYVKGHGPVMDWEREGTDSREWHQGIGAYANYRWYGDVSVDNFNAVLFGYAVYFDLAADDDQKQYIARDVDRLMTHLLDNHCRIIDVDGEVTQFGHIGIDPDPARNEYYNKLYAARQRLYGVTDIDKMPLRASLMLLPDLLIAHRVTANPRYLDLYKRVVARWQENPTSEALRQPLTPERQARTNHSSEGQSYEALYTLNRYEQDPALLAKYREWIGSLWELNWMEGNALFTYMTLAALPEYRPVERPGATREAPAQVPHAEEGLRLSVETLARFPIDRVLRPVMNSLSGEIELNPLADRGGQRQAIRPVPMDRRPLDNEYEWKGNPYRLDGWLKPTVLAFQVACDDLLVAWFADSAGRVYRTLDEGKTWQNMTSGLMGAHVQNLIASDQRTFVLWAQTDKGIFVTRDGGLSWRVAGDDAPKFDTPDFGKWLVLSESIKVRINTAGELEEIAGESDSLNTIMKGWRIPLAKSVFHTPWGLIASGPGGTYRTSNRRDWTELMLWREQETGAADYLHAYWMGRYYGFLSADAIGK
jgi:hypothetical protein